MYILFTLFFISLVGIIVMIGRKMSMLNPAKMEMRGVSMVEVNEEEVIGIPVLSDLRATAGKSAKKYGYIGLVITLRTYFKSTNFLKKKIGDAKEKVKSLGEKSKILGSVKEKGETSKFLEMVSDYKHKIRKIKKQVEKEEKARPND